MLPAPVGLRTSAAPPPDGERRGGRFAVWGSELKRGHRWTEPEADRPPPAVHRCCSGGRPWESPAARPWTPARRRWRGCRGVSRSWDATADMVGDQAHSWISGCRTGHHRHRSTAVRGQRSTRRPILSAPVHDQRLRPQLDEVGVAERTDDRVEVRLEQRQQRGVRDIAGRDDQEPATASGPFGAPAQADATPCNTLRLPPEGPARHPGGAPWTID